MVADEDGDGEAVTVRYDGGEEAVATPMRTAAMKIATALGGAGSVAATRVR